MTEKNAKAHGGIIKYEHKSEIHKGIY